MLGNVGIGMRGKGGGSFGKTTAITGRRMFSANPGILGNVGTGMRGKGGGNFGSRRPMRGSRKLQPEAI